MAVQTLSEKVKYYAPAVLRGLHSKLAIANAIGSILPNFAGGLIRTRLYRWAGFQIGHGAFFMGKVEFVSNQPNFYSKLVVGKGTVVSTHVTINLDDRVSVGSYACISPFVLIYTGSHRMGPSHKRMGEVVTKPVVIEDGAWIRVGAIILPGVTVGRGSIVGAGAVVFQDVPPNSYVEGNPAQVIRELREGDR